MTTSIPRPGAVPYHAEGKVTTLPTVAETAGYVAGSIVDPAVADALGQFGGRWIQYADLHKCQIEDIVDGSVPYLVRGQSLTYLVGAGLANLTPTQYPVVVAGCMRIAFDAAVFAFHGLLPTTFAATMRTWFYGGLPTVGGYPSLRKEAVALGTPSAVAVGEVVLGAVDTSATLITAVQPSDLGEIMTVDVPIDFTADIRGAGALVVQSGGSFTCDAGATFNVNTTMADFSAGTEVNMLSDVNVGTDAGNTFRNKGLTQLDEPVTIAAGKQLTCNGGVTVTAGNAFRALGTSLFGGLATLQAGGVLSASQSFAGGAGSVISAPTLDTNDNTGRVDVGELRFYVDAAPSFADGVLQWDGRALRLGNGTAAPHLAVLAESYVASPAPTGAAITDTGANVTILLLIGESVVVKYESEVTNDNAAGDRINLQITADGAIIGGTATRGVITAGNYITAARSVKWTAAAAGPVVFKARHGAVVGSTTTSLNVMLTVRRAD